MKLLQRSWRGHAPSCAWLLALAALAAPAWPQQAPPQDLTKSSLEDLMNIQVTSVSKKEQKLSQVAAAIFVITQEDIRRSGATNIPDLLRMVPGLEVAQIDSNTWAISSRGFNLQFADKLLVLIDGRAVYTPLFGGVNWDTQDVPLEDIDRIEVIRGPGGTVWGANAVNGVINVITKKASDTQGTLLTVGGGNLEQGFGTVQHGGTIENNTSYRIFTKYLNDGHFPDPAGQDADDGWHLLHGGFRTDSNLTGKDSLTTQGDIYTGSEGAIIVHSILSPPDDVNVQRLADLSGGNILGRWSHKFSSRSDTTVQFYFDRYIRTGPQVREARNTIDFDFQHHMRLGNRQDLIWGAGYRHTADQTIGTIDEAFIPAGLVGHLFNSFVQDEIILKPDRLFLYVGTKLENNYFSGFDFEPSARLAWTPSNRHTFWAAVSRASRTPTRRDEGLSAVLSADSLLTVINDVLDFSKIEAGKIDLEVLEFNVRDCLESTLKTLALRADEKGLELLCEIAPEVPETVRGDAARLRQVVTNLVGNAIKFTAAGEVSLKASIDGEEGTDRILHFTVSDTGIGVPVAKQKIIFDPFSQADTSTTRKYGGTGLGLTISSRLVSMMGGRIWLESEVGRGSQFHFTVRMATSEKNIQVGTAAPPEILRGVRVLVVDDNTTNQRILQGMLNRWEMRPTAVPGGDEALAQLRAAYQAGQPNTLILTDMHMPTMDGFTLVERIRETPELSASTIMMLTSAGHRGDAARCNELGVAAYLLKPIRQSELHSAIARVLGAREQSGAVPLVTRFSLQDSRDPADVLRVLVAEDNPVNQRLATRLLEKRGHRVVVAANGQEALEALERGVFDLVFMDVQMPEMGGIEATGAIRQREQGTGKHQPIIALTAHAMKGDQEKCLAAGMDGYLTKPIRPQELDQVLKKYVDMRATASEPATRA